MNATRTISWIVAALAAAAGAVLLFWTALLITDLFRPDVPKLHTAIGAIVTLAFAALAWFEAFRFFAFAKRTQPRRGGIM